MRWASFSQRLPTLIFNRLRDGTATVYKPVGVRVVFVDNCAQREPRLMRVRFWVTRGSIATPGPGTNYFGGNTSCVELTTADGDLLIIDCGTGMHPLAAKLMAQGKKGINANI